MINAGDTIQTKDQQKLQHAVDTIKVLEAKLKETEEKLVRYRFGLAAAHDYIKFLMEEAVNELR